MKLDKYIFQLLARFGSATVPGLGVFRIEHRDAFLYEGTLFPPGDIVVFAENRECRDNSLAELVMRDQKIKYEEAVSIVRTSVDEIDIRTLCGWQASLPRNFGLTDIPAPEIHHESLFGNVGRYAAAVAVALLLNLSIPVNTVPDSDIAEARLIPEFFSNTEKPEVSQPDTIVAEITVPKDYCVIVSSLETRRDALDWIIARSGCDSMEIIEGDGHFRISAARFASYQEAASFIKNRNLTAWVLHTK